MNLDCAVIVPLNPQAAAPTTNGRGHLPAPSSSPAQGHRPHPESPEPSSAEAHQGPGGRGHRLRSLSGSLGRAASVPLPQTRTLRPKQGLRVGSSRWRPWPYTETPKHPLSLCARGHSKRGCLSPGGVGSAAPGSWPSGRQAAGEVSSASCPSGSPGEGRRPPRTGRWLRGAQHFLGHVSPGTLAAAALTPPPHARVHPDDADRFRTRAPLGCSAQVWAPRTVGPDTLEFTGK